MSTATLPPTDPPLDRIAPDSLYEVVDGVIAETPPMSALSNLIKSLLMYHMARVAIEQDLGRVVTETLFILDAARNLRRRPDVAFVTAERWPLDREVNWEGDWEVVPDLCVEVTSPHDLFTDVTRKVLDYFEHGVRQVWVVNPPEKEVHIYDSRERTTIIGAEGVLANESLLPGFQLKVSDLIP